MLGENFFFVKRGFAFKLSDIGAGYDNMPHRLIELVLALGGKQKFKISALHRHIRNKSAATVNRYFLFVNGQRNRGGYIHFPEDKNVLCPARNFAVFLRILDGNGGILGSCFFFRRQE